LSGNWVTLQGTDGDVSGLACWDKERARLAVVLVNFRDRYALRRAVSLSVKSLPEELNGGHWREWTVDATHSNVWNEQGKAELTKTRSGEITGGQITTETTLMANSVTLVELLAK
jgi:hypothetical protein